MEMDTSSCQESGDLEADSEVEDTLSNGLKRSSSAPLINQLVASEQADQITSQIRLRPAAYLSASSRWRRWSTSHSPVSPVSCASSSGAGWLRLNRLKVEETGDLGKSEIANEREIQRGITMEKNLSQSWEDLRLSDTKDSSAATATAATTTPHRGRGGGAGKRATTDHSTTMLPLTIGVGPFPSPRTSPSPSPSPTRGGSSGGSGGGSSSVTGKQCYSPSMQMPVPTNLSFTPSPSSSPTRRPGGSWTTGGTVAASRRSLSPITLRPSALGPVKRKCMLDDGGGNGDSATAVTPSKRHYSSSAAINNITSTSLLQTTRSAPYKVPSVVHAPWSAAMTPQPSPKPPSETSRENSPVLQQVQPPPLPPLRPSSSTSAISVASGGPGSQPERMETLETEI